MRKEKIRIYKNNEVKILPINFDLNNIEICEAPKSGMFEISQERKAKKQFRKVTNNSHVDKLLQEHLKKEGTQKTLLISDIKEHKGKNKNAVLRKHEYHYGYYASQEIKVANEFKLANTVLEKTHINTNGILTSLDNIVGNLKKIKEWHNIFNIEEELKDKEERGWNKEIIELWIRSIESNNEKNKLVQEYFRNNTKELIGIKTYFDLIDFTNYFKSPREIYSGMKKSTITKDLFFKKINEEIKKYEHQKYTISATIIGNLTLSTDMDLASPTRMRISNIGKAHLGVTFLGKRIEK